MAEAFIALGGNLGDARTTIAKAIAVLCDGLDIVLRKRSSDYRTPPWGVADQPPFVNACIGVETALAPRALLLRAQAVERLFGRDRRNERRWGPRTLDIDLLDYDDRSVAEPGLTLPHPRLFERAFVLIPLAEIAPDRRIAGRRVAEAALAVDRTGIERLPDATENAPTKAAPDM